LKFSQELREEKKENGGGGEFKYNIFDTRTFVNAINVLPLSTIKINFKMYSLF
jgi:hypothetical protein